MTMNNDEQLRELVWQHARNGIIAYRTIGGIVQCQLAAFISQNADGILYDLNRDEACAMSDLSDPRWVNDFATAQVIRALKEEIARLQTELEGIQQGRQR